GFAAPAARAQDPEAAARVGNQAVLAGLALEPVIAIAEEHEMTLLHPLEELAGFRDFFGRQRRRLTLELRDQRAHALAHRRPIVDREADIGQCRLDVVAQSLEHRRISLTVYLIELP